MSSDNQFDLQASNLPNFRPDASQKVYSEEEAIEFLAQTNEKPFWKESPRLNPKQIKDLYKLAAVFTKSLQEAQIEHWIEGGALLGSVRHKGLIPWDEDIDFHMNINDDKIFQEKAVSLLRSQGVEVELRWYGGYRVFHADGEKLDNEPACKYPFMDVFFVKEENGSITYASPKAIWPCRLKSTELRPIKWYQFGPLELPGPHSPEEYLNDHYGDDWKTVVYQIYDHKTKENVNMIKVKLTDFYPAVPDSWP